MRKLRSFQEFLDVTEVVTGVVRFSQFYRQVNGYPQFQHSTGEPTCLTTPRPATSQVKIRSEVSGFPLSQAKSSQCKKGVAAYLHASHFSSLSPSFLEKENPGHSKAFRPMNNQSKSEVTSSALVILLRPQYPIQNTNQIYCFIPTAISLRKRKQ